MIFISNVSPSALKEYEDKFPQYTIMKIFCERTKSYNLSLYKK